MGDTAVFGIGLWAWGILVLYVGFVWLINRYQGSRAWIADGTRQKHLGQERSSAVAGGQEPRDGDATLGRVVFRTVLAAIRSEEHTSELQSLMRISSAVFCLQKKKNKTK